MSLLSNRSFCCAYLNTSSSHCLSHFSVLPFAGSDDEVNGGTLANAVLSDTHSAQLISPDGNDDATMAMIVDLLEANSGLGGAINYAGLPWPLP